MNPWNRFNFWLLWLGLLVPAAFGFALPGVMFGSEAVYDRWWRVIFPLQAFVTLLAPYASRSGSRPVALGAVQVFR